MATLKYSFIPLMTFLIYSSLLLVLFLCFPEKSQALNSRKRQSNSYLSQDSVCTHDSTGSKKRPSTLQPSIFNQTKLMETAKTLTLPVLSGKNFGTDKFIVTFGLGSPKQELSIPFNTVTNLMWTRCSPDMPTVRLDLYFNPLNSSTYHNISCNGTLCNNFFPKQNCISNTSLCIYTSKYDDQSISDGVFSLDSLNMTGEFSDFLFFCLQYNASLYSVSPNSGLLGLGRGDLSFVSQLEVIYQKYFFYCLPSNSTSKGYLTFGKNNSADINVKFTPLIPSTQYPSFYFIRIASIAVGGVRLQINYSSPVFQNPGIMIDSGTFITRLPAEAYGPMSQTFREMMGDYPMAPPHGILDTCYSNTNNQPIDSIKSPAVSFTFDGGATVVLNGSGIFHAVDKTVVCLAFANNTDPPSLSVFGNAQQKTLEVVYDVANERLGFRPNGCD